MNIKVLFGLGFAEQFKNVKAIRIIEPNAVLDKDIQEQFQQEKNIPQTALVLNFEDPNEKMQMLTGAEVIAPV